MPVCIHRRPGCARDYLDRRCVFRPQPAYFVSPLGHGAAKQVEDDCLVTGLVAHATDPFAPEALREREGFSDVQGRDDEPAEGNRRGVHLGTSFTWWSLQISG
jgi:hypothetical protein